MLWTGPLSNQNPERLQKLDPKQKLHHPPPVHTRKDSGAVGRDRSKTKGKKKKEKENGINTKLKTSSLSCKTQVALGNPI